MIQLFSKKKTVIVATKCIMQSRHAVLRKYTKMRVDETRPDSIGGRKEEKIEL